MREYHCRTLHRSDKKAQLRVAYPLRFLFSQRVGSVSYAEEFEAHHRPQRPAFHQLLLLSAASFAGLGSVKKPGHPDSRRDPCQVRLALVGYVIMPEHVHLLISESAAAPPAKIIQVFKQRVSRSMRGKKRSRKNQLSLRFPEPSAELRRFWQRRYYDFNIYSRKKLWEKLHYMHANPVEERLVRHPREWPWSSWSNYAMGEGVLKVDPA